jgi:hypothetical protein
MDGTVRRRIYRRSLAEWLLAAEALLLLAFFRVCLVVVPVHRIILTITRGPAVDRTGDEADSDENGAAARERGAATDEMREKNTAESAAAEMARRVRWAVSAVARHSPVAFVCFPQTLAGYTMLRRRGVRSTMVYGVARSAAGELTAHTWLVVGDRVVLGSEVAGEFTAVERWE